MKGFLMLLLGAICINGAYFCKVKTREGIVSGVRQVSRSGREYWAFRGIPYAEPPIGPLRFRPLVPKKPWSNVLVADKGHIECIHVNAGEVRGVEDCIYLDVFTPKLSDKSLLPVMAYIRGDNSLGDIFNDTANFPYYLIEDQVLIVVFNYRIEIFGYISTGNEAAPGNLGLKDQVMALKWVQDNIREFGGDPNEITLFGQGSGGEYVNMHTLSEASKNLFKRAIAQSGIALCPQAFTSDPSYYEIPKKVAAKFNCPTGDSQMMIECLRKVDATKLVDANSVFDEQSHLTGIYWMATKEPHGPDAFLTDTPENLIQKNNFKNGPLIIGNVVDEGTFFTSRLETDKKLYDECVKHPESVIEGFLKYYEPLRDHNLKELAKKIKDYYLGTKMSDDKDTIIYQFTKLATDFFYMYPRMQLAEKMHDVKNEVFYSYIFGYHGTLTNALQFKGENAKKIVAQGDDLYYLFAESQNHIQLTKNDDKVINEMVDWWTSFARTGVPISPHLEFPEVWKPDKIGEYLRIGSGSNTSATMQKDYNRDRMRFWSDNVPRYSLTSCHESD